MKVLTTVSLAVLERLGCCTVARQPPLPLPFSFSLHPFCPWSLLSFHREDIYMQKIRREASVCSNLCPVWMMAGQELKKFDHLFVDVTFFSLPHPLFLPQELYWRSGLHVQQQQNQDLNLTVLWTGISASLYLKFSPPPAASFSYKQ